MKIYIIFSITIITILLSGCTKDSNNIDVSQKSDIDVLKCDLDNDCHIKYNILQNNSCVSGCFNNQAKTNERCNNTYKVGLINYECKCENSKCEKGKLINIIE